MTIKNTNKAGSKGRREFLKKLWKWLGLIALAEFIYLTASMLKPSKKEKEDAGMSLKIAGAIEDFPIDSVTADRVNKFFLVRTTDGGFMALSLVCSHLGCSVIWEETEGRFLCPCHSSAFDKMGNVINSPAPRALDYFPVIVEAGKVKVDLGQKIKRKEFDTNQLTYAI